MLDDRQMALESKPLFHPEVIRQEDRAFTLPERVGDWQPKLQHWAGLIASGRAPSLGPWTTPTQTRAGQQTMRTT
jgi:hypothetical protein